MSDMLLQLGRNPQARKLVGALGLPVKLPQDLSRGYGRDDAAVLQGRRVIVAAAGAGVAHAFCRSVAELAGADVTVGDSPHALVLDATGLSSPADLRELYDFLHPRVRDIARCGRVVLISRLCSADYSPSEAACSNAVSGLARSLGKELGGKGITVNVLSVQQGANDRLGAPLLFLLSARSAFVSGQVLAVTCQARGEVPSASAANDLTGKVALVTGAARGIGAAVADRLAEQGAHLVCLDLADSDGGLCAQADRVGGTALAMDLTAPDAALELCARLGELHGGVDIVVHNAGVTRDRTLGKMGEKAWDQCLAVNLGAVLDVTTALLDAELLRTDGRLVCMASIAGIGGNPGQTNYAAAKAGLIAYVASLAPRLGARGTTANAIAPGFIETRMTAAIPLVTRELARRLNSLGQGGLPQDVADAVAFLASPGAIGISGRTLRVCGQHLAGA